MMIKPRNNKEKKLFEGLDALMEIRDNDTENLDNTTAALEKLRGSGNPQTVIDFRDKLKVNNWGKN